MSGDGMYYKDFVCKNCKSFPNCGNEPLPDDVPLLTCIEDEQFQPKNFFRYKLEINSSSFFLNFKPNRKGFLFWVDDGIDDKGKPNLVSPSTQLKREFYHEKSKREWILKEIAEAFGVEKEDVKDRTSEILIDLIEKVTNKEVAFKIQQEKEEREWIKKEREKEKKYRTILKDPELLIKLIKDIQRLGVVGEEDTILSLIIVATTRLVKNAIPESKNLFLSDETGIGKDFVTKKTLSYILPEDQYLHVTKMSKEAFTYWHNPKFEPEWTWDDKVIHFEDITQTLLNSSTFKVMASGGSYAVVVKDQVTLEIPIKGKPVMILTSHHANPKDEALRRFPIGAMDNSEQQTEKILERIAQNYSNEESENINTELRSAVRILNPYHVVVPFAELISFFFPKDILMRTHFRRFLDYISASAILHQYQREKTEDGCLIATPDDYMIARMVLIYTTSNIKMVPLSKEYRGILNILRENVEPMTIKDLEVKSDKSKVWLYRHLPFLAERGLVKKDTRFDERANRDVITYQYSLQNNPYAIPTWNDILRKIDEMTNEVDEKTENTEKTNTQNILKDRFFQWMKKLKKQGFYQVFSVGDKASNGKVFSVFSVLSNFLRERDEKKFKKYYMDKEKQSSKDSKEKEESLESFSQSPNETTPSTSNSGTKAELLEIIPYEPDTARLDAVMSHFGYKPSDSDYKSREEYIVELLKDLGRENKIRILDADFNTFAKIKEVK